VDVVVVGVDGDAPVVVVAAVVFEGVVGVDGGGLDGGGGLAAGTGGSGPWVMLAGLEKPVTPLLPPLFGGVALVGVELGGVELGALVSAGLTPLLLLLLLLPPLGFVPTDVVGLGGGAGVVSGVAEVLLAPEVLFAGGVVPDAALVASVGFAADVLAADPERSSLDGVDDDVFFITNQFLSFSVTFVYVSSNCYFLFASSSE